MTKSFYLVKMVDMLEPDLAGPFPTEAKQEEALVEIVKGDTELGPNGESSICWLEIDEGGVPSMGTYSAWYMNSIRKQAGYEIDDEDLLDTEDAE